MNGVIIVNKSDNITSQQVVGRIKYKFQKKYKVGHYGTLDPKATGVLPIAVGKATKLFDFFQNKVKVYRAIFRFGTETTTLDSEGEVASTCEHLPTEDEVREALGEFVGELKQTPPLYSANKIDGKRAYQLARENVAFETKVKNVTVYRFELVRQMSERDFLFEIECSSGTYIRSLCRDLAKSLDTVGYMPLLVRTKAGMFDISESVSMAEIDEAQDLSGYVVPLDKVIDLPTIALDDYQTRKFSNGVKIKTSHADGLCKVFGADGDLVAIGGVADGVLSMEVYLYD